MVQSSENIRRIREAAKYQKLAIRALFPESMDSHLTVIERELKAMGKDLLTDVVKEVMKEVMAQNMEDADRTGDSDNGSKSDKSRTRKVTID